MDRTFRHSLPLIVAALLVNASVAFPQTNAGPPTDRDRVVPFLGGTRVLAQRPSAGILFEAHIQPNLVIYQHLSDELVQVRFPSSRAAASEFLFSPSFSASPAVRLRMLHGPSDPVRTPSYMPRLDFQGFWFKNAATPVLDSKVRNDATHRLGMFSVRGTVGHHSNGQEGCLFAEDTLVDDACVPPEGGRQTGSINEQNGDFSTSYWLVGVRHRWMWLDTSTDEQCCGQTIHRTVGQLTVGGEFESHPVGFLGRAGISSELRALYGGHRLRASFAYGHKGSWLTRVINLVLPSHRQLHWNFESVRTSFTKIANVAPGVRAYGWHTELLTVPGRYGQWGFLIGYYRGQDYYNLGFRDSISRFQFGVAFEQDGLLTFRSQS